MRSLDSASKGSREECSRSVKLVATTFSNIVTVYHGALGCQASLLNFLGRRVAVIRFDGFREQFRIVLVDVR